MSPTFVGRGNLVTDKNISEFLAATGSLDRKLAREYLVITDNDLDAAVKLFRQMKASTPPRRSSRIAKKVEETFVDLSNSSPDRAVDEAGEKKSKLTEFGVRLDGVSKDLLRYMRNAKSNGEVVDELHLERIARGIECFACALKSIDADCTMNHEDKTSEHESDEDSGVEEDELSVVSVESYPSAPLSSSDDSVPDDKNEEDDISCMSDGGSEARGMNSPENSPSGSANEKAEEDESSEFESEAYASGASFRSDPFGDEDEEAYNHPSEDSSSQAKNPPAESPRRSPVPSPAPAQKPSFFGEDAKENMPDFNTKASSSPVSTEPKDHTPVSNVKVPSKSKKKKFTMEDQVKIVDDVLSADKSGKSSYYRVLGLSTNATDAEIKKSYHKRAVKLHPDKNKAPRAVEAFRAAKSAYDVLKSPSKRTVYDRNNVTSDASRAARSAETGSGANSSGMYMPGSSPFNTIRPNTRVFVQDPNRPYVFSHIQEGAVQYFNSQTNKYGVRMWSGESQAVEPSAVLQLFRLKLRESARQARSELYSNDIRFVRLVSRQGEKYQVRCFRLGEERFTVGRSDFVIPNGAIVRLEGLEQKGELNGSYGKVVNSVEKVGESGTTSYYDVQLSQSAIVRAKIANVRL